MPWRRPQREQAHLSPADGVLRLSALRQLTALKADCLPGDLAALPSLTYWAALTRLQRLELGAPHLGRRARGANTAPAPVAATIGRLSCMQRLTALTLSLGSDGGLRRLPADLSAVSALQHLSLSSCALDDVGGWEQLAQLSRLTRCGVLPWLPHLTTCSLPRA